MVFFRTLHLQVGSNWLGKVKIRTFIRGVYWQYFLVYIKFYRFLFPAVLFELIFHYILKKKLLCKVISRGLWGLHKWKLRWYPRWNETTYWFSWRILIIDSAVHSHDGAVGKHSWMGVLRLTFIWLKWIL